MKVTVRLSVYGMFLLRLYLGNSILAHRKHRNSQNLLENLAVEENTERVATNNSDTPSIGSGSSF